MMEREFILTSQFEKQLTAISTETELLIDIEHEISLDLERDIIFRDIIPGTGGFTKIRVPLKNQNIGKRGALRVIYIDFEEREVTFLFMIYSKKNIENLSEHDKKTLKMISQELKKWAKKKE